VLLGVGFFGTSNRLIHSGFVRRPIFSVPATGGPASRFRIGQQGRLVFLYRSYYTVERSQPRFRRLRRDVKRHTLGVGTYKTSTVVGGALRSALLPSTIPCFSASARTGQALLVRTVRSVTSRFQTSFGAPILRWSPAPAGSGTRGQLHMATRGHLERRSLWSWRRRPETCSIWKYSYTHRISTRTRATSLLFSGELDQVKATADSPCVFQETNTRGASAACADTEPRRWAHATSTAAFWGQSESHATAGSCSRYRQRDGRCRFGAFRRRGTSPSASPKS